MNKTIYVIEMGSMRAKKFCCDFKFFWFVFDQNKSIFILNEKIKIKIPATTFSHLIIPITYNINRLEMITLFS